MKISSMGDRHEATHEAPPSGLPHRVGELRTARREREALSPCMGRVGVGRGSACHGAGNIERPSRRRQVGLI